MNHDFEEHEHVGWADGERDNTVDFDYDEIDRRLAEIEALPPEAQADVSAVLARLFAWTWAGNGSLRSALVRHTALYLGLRPDLVDRTYRSVGSELGCTKQNLSKSVLKAEKLLKMKFRRTRSRDGRQAMAAARLRNPIARNTRKAA